MPPSMYSIAPLVAAAAFLIVLGFVSGRGSESRSAWTLTAALAAIFAAWSIHAVLEHGLKAVWDEHIRNAWANQIWFDLLLAIGTAYALLLPRARASGMRAFPWLLLIACTGSIGLLAMLARCQFLESNRRTRGEA
ncbi:hypothetical protein C3942_20930 [Solimonas fluminis]|uniref:DUF2834 domain-containing protein n=1 Tax=Solimonas fluminis TaxID=2086571 RepID=A0A2S5TAX3_9GAMM|nr:hypothetical protein [Solimonas fluminis]PPE72007.1 hypothetical protein C3942_20930 [Solimonas fluminis]